jgi:hypothetical protein
MYHILGRGVTTDTQLRQVGKSLFGDKFLGVFHSGVKPMIFHKQITSRADGNWYGIINTSKFLSSPGKHWIGVIVRYRDKQPYYYIWDSFSRRSKRIIPKFIKSIGGYRYININTNGSNQKSTSSDCGQRTLAALAFAKKYGLANLQLI